MRIAFVLQGGGGLAATQVGQLRALWECGIVPDFVVGTSSGAINAVAFTQDPTEEGLDRMERLWTGLRPTDVFPFDVFSLMTCVPNMVTGLIGWHDGLLSPKRLRRLIERNLDVSRLEDTQLPVHVVATDLASGQPIVLSSGSAADALLASTALPGVFPPVKIGGRPLIDGGVSAGTPIRQAEELEATVTYVLPTIGPAPPQELPRGVVPMLLRAISQVLGNASATDLQAARCELHVLPAPGGGVANPFDLRCAARLITAGYEEAKAALRTRSSGVSSSRSRLAPLPSSLNSNRPGTRGSRAG